MSDARREGQAQVGDVVEITGHRVGEAARTGEILDVLGPVGSVHYRVRWDDGHDSLLYPSSDTVVRQAPARAEKPK